MFERKIVSEILRFTSISPRRLQIVIGPRQVGKTTAAKQAALKSGYPSHYASADEALPPGPEWIEAQWNAALRLGINSDAPVWLILDEIQKVRGWSEEIKRLWDTDTTRKIQPLLLGSSALLLQKGLSESLAGRFFLHRCTHWAWPEMREAFGWDLDTWMLYGGYPGAANYINDPELWLRYINDSLIEKPRFLGISFNWRPSQNPLCCGISLDLPHIIPHRFCHLTKCSDNWLMPVIRPPCRITSNF